MVFRWLNNSSHVSVLFFQEYYKFLESCYKVDIPRDGQGSGGGLSIGIQWLSFMYVSLYIHRVHLSGLSIMKSICLSIMKPRLFETVSWPHPFGVCYSCPKGCLIKL